MTAETPTQVPAALVAGDTWTWKRSLDDYPAGTYTAAWHFDSGLERFTVSASADGTAHAGSVAAATTAGYAPGKYRWALVVTKVSDSSRTTVEQGLLEVSIDPAATGSADRRSHARKVLDAIEAVLENRASVDQASYSINGRSLARTPIADLLKLRDTYKAEVSAEEAGERIKLGLGGAKRVLVRF